MKVFIDFDDVILNTKAFVAELKDFFKCHGVSEELFRKHYYDATSSNEVKLFNPWTLIDRLEKEENMEVGKLRRDFAAQIEDLSNFVFSDVQEFLSFAGKQNVYLISFGLPAFQNEKILACGINNLVAGCVVTSGSKAHAIKKVMEAVKIDSSEQLIFVDDRVEQVQDIKNVFPNVKTFLLCRKEGRYCDQKNEYCDYEIHNLKEAQEIIAKL